MNRLLTPARSQSRGRFAIAVTVLVLQTASTAPGVTWDTAPGDGASITEGAGTWQVGVGNWNDSASDVNWSDGNDAVFGGGTGGSAGTVSLGADISASRIFFNPTNAGTYTIDLAGFNLGVTSNTFGAITGNSGFGSALITDSVGTGTLSVPGTGFSINLTGSMAISAQISGAGRVFTAGAGNLTVSNSGNDFTGEFGKQNGGVLSFDSIADTGVASAAGAGSSISVGFNAQLAYTGAAASTNRELRLFGSNGTFNNNGSGALVMTGTVNNQMNNNMTFNLGGSNTGGNEIQGAISDNGTNVLNFNKAGGGNWILSGANTYTGLTTIGGGVLQANAADVAATSGALGNGGEIRFTGGTLQFSALSAGSDYSARIANSTGAISIDTNGQDVTFGTALANTNTGGLFKTGLGTLDIRMGGSYTGTTTIDGGTLRFTNVADLASVSTPAFNINNGSTLEFESTVGGANRTVLNNKTFTFDGNGGGTINFNNGNHLMQGGVHTFTTTGGLKNTISRTNGGFINNQGSGNTVFNVADGLDEVDLELSAEWRDGTLTKSGAGTMAITGVHRGDRAIDVDAGTLEVAGSARLNLGTFTAGITNDGVFKHSSDQPQTISGDITGSGALWKSGGAALTLSGNNSFTGTTTVSGGTLVLQGTNGLAASSAVNVGAGAVLDVSGTTAPWTLGSSQTLTGSGTILGGAVVGGIHAPGNSPGIQTFSTDLTYDTGASLLWELAGNNTSLGDRGTVFDGINVGGNLDFAGSTTVTLSFNGAGSTVDWSDILWGSDQSWLLYDVDGATGNLTNLSIFTDNWLDGQGDLFNTVLSGGSFGLSQTGSDVYLNYTAIPEPSRVVLLGFGALLVLMRRCRA